MNFAGANFDGNERVVHQPIIWGGRPPASVERKSWMHSDRGAAFAVLRFLAPPCVERQPSFRDYLMVNSLLVAVSIFVRDRFWTDILKVRHITNFKTAYRDVRARGFRGKGVQGAAI